MSEESESRESMANSVKARVKSFAGGVKIQPFWGLMTKNVKTAIFSHPFGSLVQDYFAQMCDLTGETGARDISNCCYVN